jgi:hypothetical protein
MPDPHKDLAPIIGPSPPPPVPHEGGWVVPTALGLLAVLLMLGLVWYWRRRAPQRELRRLSDSPDAGQGGERLAALMRRHHHLGRLEAHRCPPALAGREAAWRAWVLELERLRFAPPTADDGARLARLVREGEALLMPGGR